MPKFHFFYLVSAIIFLQFNWSSASAQQRPSSEPKKYLIDTILIDGIQHLDPNLIRLSTGLSAGDQVLLENDPAIAKSIRNLWAQNLFSDISIAYTNIQSNTLSLKFSFVERPKLSSYSFTGLNKTQETEIKDKLQMVQHRMVTKALKKDIHEAVKSYLTEKGYLNVQTSIEERVVGTDNSVSLIINVDKGRKVRINQVNISGNESIPETRLKSRMGNSKEMPRLSLYPANKETVYDSDKPTFKNYIRNQGYLSLSKTMEALNPYFRWNVFASSKYIPKKFEEDKREIIREYNARGYRDAQILEDTFYFTDNGHINIEAKVQEGKKYYFGDIEWVGNTKYSDSLLARLVGIKKGDVFNAELLDARLGMAPSMDGSLDIGSLYMDDGYLFFRVEPKEKSIESDTINYVVNIQEGPQATIKRIQITGNDRTNDHVLRRELFTLPGNKFSRADIIRSIRQVANLGFIDPEKVNPVPIPNYMDGTVDINYEVAEKSSDQLELSAGFGGGIGFTGTIGIVFNNFSLRNIANFKAWDPLPMGDGQKLSIRYQSNGLWFNSANLSFTEPWLGGKKPTALTLNLIYGRQSYSEQGFYNGNPNDHYLRNLGGGVMLSKRLNWPDNNFIFSYGVNYQNYHLKDYTYFVSDFINGDANNLFVRLTLARNSVDQPIYPRSGANVSLTLQFTPPYSSFSETNYAEATPAVKYKWVEYHKYRFTTEWYQGLGGDFVLKLAAKYGFVGFYNQDIGYSPFERFNVGGDGLSGFNMFVGRDIISHRGYEVYAPDATIFNKYTAEVRYPFSLNPSATIFGLAFVEAANGWNNFREYNPFKLYRSAGLGVRVYLPMFGLLGLDYGLGFDRLGDGVKFGNATKFTFMLGFEPD